MIASAIRGRALVRGLAALVLLAAALVPPAAAGAAAGPAVDPLRREIVDVALLPPGGRDGAPRLLTVAYDEPLPGGSRLTVLERANGRWAARAEVADEPPMVGATTTPWLVALDARRFALLAVAPRLRETWVRIVTWTGEELRLGPRGVLPRPIDDAGAADVDGDGRRELVLAEASTRRAGPTCQGSRLVVADPVALEVLADHDVPNLRLAAGSIGPLDAEPGDELLATAFRNCPAGPASADRFAFAAIRLSDGERLLERSLTPADGVTAWSGRPALVDIDRDARPEVLLGSPDGLHVIDPGEGWSTSLQASLPGVLLGAVASPEGGATVATLDGSWLATGRVRVADDAPDGIATARWAAYVVSPRRSDAALVDGRASALRHRGGPAWVDRSSACPTLVVSLAVVGCGGGTGAAVAPGPAWVGTRPLARIEATDGDVLLVARSESWPGAPARFGAPGPLAAEPEDAGWRHGPSQPFSLIEVPTGQLLTPRADPPRLAPIALGDPPTTTVDAIAGSRVILDLAPPGDTVASVRLGSLLAGPAARAARLRIVEVGDAALRVPLPGGFSGDRADETWEALAIAVGPLGDVSAPVRVRIERDTAPPALRLDVPLLMPPWPLDASVIGRTEPGTRLIVLGRPVEVAADGSFRVTGRFAPWPQRVVLKAVDGSGNETTLATELVGGLDYRQLPWVAILVVGLLAAALVGVVRSGGSRAPRPGNDEDPSPAIEELPPSDPRSATATRALDRG